MLAPVAQDYAAFSVAQPAPEVNPEERESLQSDMARAADGDRAALDPIFLCLHPFVVGFCRRVLGDHRAEDAAHDALLQLFRHINRYDAERDPVAWILAFASNACRTVQKRSQRQKETGDLPDQVAADNPEAAMIEAELRTAVQETLRSLSALDAETLTLAMGERPSGSTFRKRLERAAARFRAQWSLR